MQWKFHVDFYQTDPNENNENKKLFHKNDLFEDIFDKHIFVSHDLKLKFSTPQSVIEHWWNINIEL